MCRPPTCFHVDARAADGRVGVCEVGGWGEEFVGEGEDAGVEGVGDEVW